MQTIPFVYVAYILKKKMHCNVFPLWFEWCKNLGIGYGQWETKASVSAQNFSIAPKDVPVKDTHAQARRQDIAAGGPKTRR